ncbi:hypothetical protein OGAPHI_001805 [Ogataea philodendri]|uniref:Glutathione S-transferase n=1 Tax=Ogataea philodendri TaxID=1378263 RepID=A0A9P8PAA4_9ASCO|nr:uncharacterized protein OGAPHI_001805 [Ogataea philodendri]KAH3668051.1 hypothetical protein OGAPHI_001805 [Ogataea philodendri]
MSSSTLYLLVRSPRSSLFPDLVKYLGLDIEIKDNTSPELGEEFPLKKCPALIEADGFKVTEALAVFRYLAHLAPEKLNWYGKTPRQDVETEKWLSFFNSEVMNAYIGWLLPKLGVTPYDEEKVNGALQTFDKYADIVEKQLQKTKYLVGDEPTIADLYALQYLKGAYSLIWDETWIKKHPEISRWIELLKKNPVVGESIKDLKLAAATPDKS